MVQVTLLSVFLLFTCAFSVLALEVADDHHLRNKRGWNGAKGMWGKRYAVDEQDDGTEDLQKRTWSKASGMWGKRSDEDELDGPMEEKRTWQKASGMWGKRGGWNGAKGMWGRRKRSPNAADATR